MDLNQSFLFKIRARNLFRAALKMFPKDLQHRASRSMIRLNLDPPGELRLSLAKSQEELEAAFRILHDEYVRAGFMKPHPTGMRITRYHALPSTSVLIAKWADEVVGTVSIVRSSPFGFPLDKIFDTEHLKLNGARLAEISALAIRQDFRQNRGTILFPLLKFVFEYCLNYFGVDFMVIAVNPAHIDFYESILAFKRLTGEIKSYDFVEGAPAVGAFLNTETAFLKYATSYAGKAAERSIFHYFFEFSSGAFQFPDRQFYNISDPIMSPTLLHHFFNGKSQLFRDFSEHEKSIICSLYNYPEYRDVLPDCPVKDALFTQRRQVRHDVQCQGRVVLSETSSVSMVVKDVSSNGFRACLDQPFDIGDKNTINIVIADFEVATLAGRLVWRGDQNMVGFQIDESSDNWKSFVEHLDNQQAQRELIAAS